MVLIALPSSANASYSPNPPTITKAQLSINSLPDSGGAVTVTVDIHTDNGLGGNPVVISIVSKTDPSRTLAFGQLDETDGGGGVFGSGASSICVPSASASINACPSNPPTAVVTDPTFSKTFNVSGDLMPGIYELAIYSITDKSQNSSVGFDYTDQLLSYGVPLPTLSPIATPTPSASPSPSPQMTQIDDSSKWAELLPAWTSAYTKAEMLLGSPVAKLPAMSLAVKTISGDLSFQFTTDFLMRNTQSLLVATNKLSADLTLAQAEAAPLIKKAPMTIVCIKCE